MYYKSNPSNYTRCEKCKHIDRENEKCKITNDEWLVSDDAGTCHQFEGVTMKVKAKRDIWGPYYAEVQGGKIYDVIKEDGSCFVIINDAKVEKGYLRGRFKVVEDDRDIIVEDNNKYNAIKPNHYKSGNFDVIAFCFEHDLDFATGNIIKYVTRAGKKDKDKTLEDLEKAMEYLRRKMENIKTNDK